jgi:hypothetical protein
MVPPTRSKRNTFFELKEFAFTMPATRSLAGLSKAMKHPSPLIVAGPVDSWFAGAPGETALRLTS